MFTNRGGKIAPVYSSVTDVNPSTYTCGRLSAMMQEGAFVVTVSFMKRNLKMQYEYYRNQL